MKITRNVFFAVTCIILSIFGYGNVPSILSDSTTTVLQMHDVTASFGMSTYSGRPIQAEYASGTSYLVGKSIDNIVVDLKKIGLPTGTVQVGVFNDDLSLKQLFGTMDATTISTSSYTQYSFSLPIPQTYQIQSGDRIGIKFAGGDSSNFVAIMTDKNDTFDGTNSYQTYYTTAWQISGGKDLTMTLQLHVSATGPTISSTPAGGIYNSPQSVTLSASAPATIYYTTNGSTPTTSSASGPSPVTGITIRTNSTLKFFAKDSLGNIGPVGSAQYTIVPPVIIQMNDTTSSYKLSTYSGRPIQAEYISGTSSLVGKSIDTITVKLHRTGAPTGTVQVGVFNNNLSVKQLFGTMDATTISTSSYTQYSFSLPTPQTYQIQSGDRIGIKFAGGDSSNFVAIMTDQNDTFDSTNSYLTYYTTSWKAYTGIDLTMTLQLHVYIDPFGIKKIYPDSPGGMQWYSTTFNMARTNTVSSVDSVDHWLDFSHGDGNYTIAKSILSASPRYSASAERIYIHNPNLQSEWHNIEITVYARNDKMDTSIPQWAWSGVNIGARINHGTNGNEDLNLCDDRGYYGRFLLSSTSDFEKSTRFDGVNGYDEKSIVRVWPGNMPLNQWIGYKYIVYNKVVNGVTGVQMETWIDKNNNGEWTRINSFFDNGTNYGRTGPDSACKAGVDPRVILNGSPEELKDSETGKPHLSVIWRTDGQWMSYKEISVREIIPPS